MLGHRHAVATGFAIAIPEGYEVQVRPRSGLALKHGITCLNTPGTIDHAGAAAAGAVGGSIEDYDPVRDRVIVFGGFLVTQRMLQMFKRKERKKEGEA